MASLQSVVLEKVEIVVVVIKKEEIRGVLRDSYILNIFFLSFGVSRLIILTIGGL